MSTKRGDIKAWWDRILLDYFWKRNRILFHLEVLGLLSVLAVEIYCVYLVINLFL